jgi:arylsulfatase
MESGEFRGRIARHIDDSEPWWPELLRPPAGAPNVLIVVLDDVGFAQLGCFGSDIDTPHLDGLAAGGIRYTNFHTTALCSPTRACVLTGRNHHSCGMGRIADLATGFPGYDARIPRSCAFLPRMLLEHGYATYGAGKWHLTPEEEAHLGARRDHWPLARGFERFYGFHGGETHQFAPTLFHDNHVVPPPSTYDEGYHVTEDIADRTIEFLTDLRHVDPAKPWMFYLATGACHSPHQAPAPWIERYRGAFDDGWDVWREATLAEQKAEGVIPDHAELSPRPDWVPPWDSLSADTRAVYARYMEAFAGFLSHADDQIGRVVAWLDETDQLDNTLVFVLSDNGASSEGGPTGSVNDARAWNALPRTVAEAHERLDEIGGPRLHNNYPWGWTVAGNTPFKRWKRETHEGGVADPLIVHWPAGMSLEARGTLRTQYVHAIDVVPTVLEALGTDAPGVVDGVEQRPIEGTSFIYSFDEPDEPERHTTQYYEMFGCRALYHDGWKAVSYHEIQSDEPGLDRAPWELYDLRADPSECHDRAEAEPARLEAMIERWWAEADRYQVLPLDNRPFSAAVLDRPRYVGDRTLYEYWPHRAPVPEEQAANVRNRPHQVAALIEVEEGPSPFGALVVQGSVLGGWSLHLTESGTLCYVHNLSGLSQERVEADIELTPGLHALAFRYTPAVDGDPASGSLRLDGDVVGEATIESFTWSRFSLTGAGLTVGYAAEFPPSDDFVAPYRFTGKLQRVFIEVEGDRQVDAAVAAADAIAME